jgi:HTH-type transcriptional regulator / antitoxin HigA
MNVKPVKTEADYRRALLRVQKLWDASKRSARGDELEVLVVLIEAYERERYPIVLPDPIDAINFRLQQKGLDNEALIGIIGGRPRVSEAMNRKRPLSINMIRRLHKRLGIPAEVLIQRPRPASTRSGRSSARRRRVSRRSA